MKSTQGSLYFVFHQGNILCPPGSEVPRPFTGEEWARYRDSLSFEYWIGLVEEQKAFVIELAATIPGLKDCRLFSLRALLTLVEEPWFRIWGKAEQILNWHHTNRFCGVCGSKTNSNSQQLYKECPSCNTIFYPRISPCAIVLISRGAELLLAHAAHFPEGLYSNLAGFVEVGESLEETIDREVFEEVGIRVKNIRYFGSQPWPFPGQLMVAFTAEYDSGELNPDNKEITDVQWWHHDQLPMIPDEQTISGRLIRVYIDEFKKRP